MDELSLRVTIPDVSAGLWTVIKSEVNLTDLPWRSWEITFGTGTRIIDETLISSRQFAKLTNVPARNALVFHGGEVVPGESVLKVFRVEQEQRSKMDFSHNRMSQEATALQIEEGFPQLPVVEVRLETRRI